MFHVKHGSRQQEVEIRHGQPIVQREVDAVADELGGVAHDGVNVARRDEHLLGAWVVRKAARVDDRRQPDGRDRYAERGAVKPRAIVADAAAGRDAGVGELNGAAEALRLGAGERIDHNDGIRVQAVGHGADELGRLGRTVQLTDTGITPGSGVGNDRAGLSRDTLGIPVAAIGLPTVIDAGGFSDDPRAEQMFVTPRDIDTVVRDAAKLIGYGINLALHDGLTIGDVDMFLS